MFELERLGAPIYVVFVIPAIPLRSDGVELNATDTEEIRLPPKYEDYANVFSEEEASKFPDSTRVEHSIPIEEGAEVPHGPIY
jgi:Reverse transcriptase (RNA-dependent DNA polymerase)